MILLHTQLPWYAIIADTLAADTDITLLITGQLLAIATHIFISYYDAGHWYNNTQYFATITFHSLQDIDITISAELRPRFQITHCH